MACQLINGITWVLFFLFSTEIFHDDFPMIKGECKGEYSIKRKDATFYNEMLHLCFVIIISDGLQETLEAK